MIGLEFGGYRVVRQLGEGGMGAVFLAEHRQIDRKVAIKILLPALSSIPDAVARFFAEARAASLIKHPGIVEVFECGELHGRAFILMEYLDGENLAAALARAGKLAGDLGTALAIAARIADAVGAAHTKQIVHRDLKPENVFLVAGNGPMVVKILDFGVAKLLADAEPSRTRSGSLVGTPKYMSPEQCRGLKTIDHRADIYSLGCILFELLCGRPPFVKDATGDLLIAHVTEAPPSARSLEPEVPAELDVLVAAMLAKEPADRPPSMSAVAERLQRVRERAGPAITQVSEPGPAMLGETTSSPTRRRPRWPVVALPVVVAGVVVAGGWVLGPRRPGGPVAAPAPVQPAAPPSAPPPPPTGPPPPPSAPPAAPSLATPQSPRSLSVRRPARHAPPEQKIKPSSGTPVRKVDRNALLDL
jgi:serine/threonine-protein kinase